MLGTTLGHYRIVEKLGAGGMGEVYRARDERLERDVAIKVLPAATLGDDAARSRFRKEALALGRLNHPNIGTVHDFDTQEGVDFIVMELVAGESLAEMLRRGPVPERQILSIGAQAASALEDAHERGIVHRDLKPGNIVITPKGQAKVLDFGLARLLASDAGDLTASVSGQHLVGTVPYMAPEQLRGQPADARTDVWALGVLLHEMAAGVRPFDGQTGFELSSAILHQPARPLPSHAPPWLRAIIERCLEKDPARRYQRAADVRAAIEAVQTSGVARWAGWRYQLRHQRRLVVGAAVVAVLGVIAWLDVGELRTRLTGRPAAPRIERLAVLPLENLSGDAAQDYFADGMTETLITDLTRLGVLKRVTARASVMRYRRLTKSLAEVARELNVDAFVMGSVLRSGGRVSITAQLVDPKTEELLWTNRYEGDLQDVIRLQNQIVSAIVREIRAKLSPDHELRLASARVVNPEAQDAYLRARFHWQRLTPEDFKTAMAYCEKALALDPTDAQAHHCMSYVHASPAHMGFVAPSTVAAKVRAEGLKAIELDPTWMEAYAHLALWTFLMDWDWAAAAELFRKAGELSATSRVVRADLHMVMGEREDALREIRRSLDDDPLNSWTQTAVGGRMLRLGRYDEGIALLQKALTLDPNMGLAHRYLWTAFHGQGNVDRAFEHAKTFLVTLGHGEVAQTMQGSLASGGYIRAMALGADGLAARSRTTYVQATEIARLYAYAGDRDRAFDWLDRAYDARDTWMSFVNTDPRFDSLHSDPRFRALLQRMKMPL